MMMDADAGHRRPNRLEIDALSVVKRVAGLRASLGPDVRIYAALKGDGYGFGTLPMARAALDGGADALALLDRAEALALRRAGIAAPILLYAGSPIDAPGVAAAVAHGLTLTVLSLAEIDMVARHATGPVDLAIKLEVGAERLGVLPEMLTPMAAAIARAPHLRLALVNAHPTFRDTAPDAVIAAMYERFLAAVALLPAAGLPMPTRLFASSRTMGRRNDMALDAVDPGQLLFSDVTDRPIISALTSVLTQVRDVTRDFDAAHAPFDVTRVRRVGVIPFGRVDGGGRCHGPSVLVNGKRAAIVGPPSLEYMRIDLTEHPDAAAGDAVALIGRQGDAAISLHEVCSPQNGIPADIAMTIGPAVQRHYTMTEEPAA
jgi:alanine racemase